MHNLNNNHSDKNIENFIHEISDIILTTKRRVQSNINSEMVLLYWNIGKYIRKNIYTKENSKYGQKTILLLSKELTNEFGRGYSRSNLFNMINFHEKFDDFEIVQTLSGQLSWSHLLEILKLDDDLKMEFYTTLTINEHWSVRVLKSRIDSMLFERTAISKLPEETIKNDLIELVENKKMSKNLFFRDPYMLDFLELHDTYNEKDFEDAILVELEKFMLEFGRDFTFVGRQVRITVGNTDYYIDLLFYHRKMKRLVVIELKLGEFKPEHKGQVELYLRWLDKHERNEGEESPIGIILCAAKSDETVELLQLDESNIHVGQYITQMPSKELFQEKLHKAVEIAKTRYLNK